MKRVKDLLTPDCRSLWYGNLQEFVVGDKNKMPVIYPEDWDDFCYALDLQLTYHENILKKKFDIEDIFFYEI